jgi:hypothetical protein
MPQALEVDHDYVKGICSQVGIREGARIVGLDELLVLKWAEREKWTEQWKQLEQAKALKVERQGLSSLVIDPSEAYAKYKGKTKLKLCRVVDKTANGLNKLKPVDLANKTGAVLNTVSAYAKLYPDAQVSTSTVNVQVLNQVNVPIAP